MVDSNYHQIRENAMCLGANEPNGPKRCSGHARAAYDKAVGEHVAATEKAGEARATHSALIHAAAAAANDRDAARAKLDNATADNVAALEVDYDAKYAESARLMQSAINADRAREKLVAEQRHAGAVMLSRRAAYDSTPEGLARLELDIDQSQRTLRDMAARGEAQTHESNALAGSVHDMLSRRAEAESRMEDEAEERRHNRDFTPFDSELEQRRIDEIRQERDALGEDPDDSHAAGERALLGQTITRRQADLNAHRRTDAKLGGYRAANAGHAERTADESKSLQGVSSIQRPMYDSEGRETIEARLFRMDGDERISTTVEVPREAFPAPTDALDALHSQRDPSTTRLVRYLQDARAHNAKGRTLAEHTANGGSKDDWYAGVKAARALDALFGQREAVAAA
ncbi:hypothetical protein GCM10025867_50490 (plasmid) [Frondihabitans sucicola]|uniref:DUF222 domain-containing protein n=1 Tax=Frondihabitans sucicola TaxID=1268041 RepID=A0ABM8GWE0_9MICO|nr:hypothetical protein [Frondihabitans sucicola]BDZ52808.1 hypothetical protein GCM10025867_50490 [Frondihabitans sucicola]